jgi:hypothetical protein
MIHRVHVRDKGFGPWFHDNLVRRVFILLRDTVVAHILSSLKCSVSKTRVYDRDASSFWIMNLHYDKQ